MRPVHSQHLLLRLREALLLLQRLTRQPDVKV
jgi:hypothetical protein